MSTPSNAPRCSVCKSRISADCNWQQGHCPHLHNSDLDMGYGLMPTIAFLIAISMMAGVVAGVLVSLWALA